MCKGVDPGLTTNYQGELIDACNNDYHHDSGRKYNAVRSIIIAKIQLVLCKCCTVHTFVCREALVNGDM